MRRAWLAFFSRERKQGPGMMETPRRPAPAAQAHAVQQQCVPTMICLCLRVHLKLPHPQDGCTSQRHLPLHVVLPVRQQQNNFLQRSDEACHAGLWGSVNPYGGVHAMLADCELSSGS